MTVLRTTLLCLTLLCLGNSAFAADSLRSALEDSKSSGKGLNFYVNGQTIAGVVVSVDDKYVIAKSQAQGTIVIKLEKIDGVAGFVGQATSGSK